MVVNNIVILIIKKELKSKYVFIVGSVYFLEVKYFKKINWFFYVLHKWFRVYVRGWIVSLDNEDEEKKWMLKVIGWFVGRKVRG